MELSVLKSSLTSRSERLARQLPASALILLCSIAGCAKQNPGGTTGTGTPADPATYSYLTGNWQFTLTATSGDLPFATLGGFINEQATSPGVDDLTTAALQSEPGACYLGTTTLPFQGASQGTHLGLASFAVSGQVASISATSADSASTLSGTYSIVGGCANGEKGTLSGIRYGMLNGTYAGSLTGTASPTLSLAASQYSQGTGAGSFLDGATVDVTGISCFTHGEASSANGSVVGNKAQFTFTTNDPNGSTFSLVGTLNVPATTLTLSSVQVLGGNCAGTYPLGTLSK